MTPDRPFNGHTKVLLMAAMVLVPLSLLLSTVAAVGGYFTSRDVAEQNDRLEAENLARQEAQCESADESRTVIRAMSKDSALEVGEALIEAVPDANPETVAAFRDAMNRRLTAIVNQLPGRRWDPDTGECVDVVLEE